MDIREIVFTRDGESFTFGLTPPYQLHPDTLLPSAQALDSSGIEYLAGPYTPLTLPTNRRV